MAHEHDIDTEFLHPGDVDVVGLYEGTEGDPRVTLLVPCPECDQAVELDAGVESVDESDLSLPLEETTDVYD